MIRQFAMTTCFLPWQQLRQIYTFLLLEVLAPIENHVLNRGKRLTTSTVSF